jgi:hypothetical protein
MTGRELLLMLYAESPENLECEIKVWLPGSRISLTGRGLIVVDDIMMIEGNLDEGSVLS